MNVNQAAQQLMSETDHTYTGMNMLHEIEETIFELKVYIERNPEDDIAQRQYRHFLTKREKWLPTKHKGTESASIGDKVK